MRTRLLLCATLLTAAHTAAASAQAPAADAARGDRPSLGALRVSTAPVIDGRLDEEAWQRAVAATDFIQRAPRPGEAATQRTEARVAYDDEAIYVAIRAYDSAPDSIASQLARRDATGIFSDWVDVLIDSYHDRRSGYRFAVNPHGVKKDVYHFNDGQEDISWDAIWDVATSVDAEGWVAEFRIPLSQIRYTASAGTQTWGLQFGRTIARREEMSFWAPVIPGSGGFMSLAGTLTDIAQLGSPKRLEVLPYALSKVTRAPEPRSSVRSPFWRANDAAGTAGADVKYGLTSNLTLTGTINPDFGQVEADPSVVNLSAFETFFPERRPFFLEGASLFNFEIGDQGSGEGLFYSRRVGRAPQRTFFAGADHVDMPEAATIAGAGKVTGRVGGWSIGFFDAITQAETAEVLRNDTTRAHTVEPLTNYAVGRLNRDFRGGASTVGVMFTTTHRRIADAELEFLRSAAYSAGITGSHRFGPGNRFEVSGYLAGSRIEGDTLAIQLAQLAPQRYFQRPDAEHVEFDAQRTSLNGVAGTFSIGKIAGGRWNGGVGTSFRTPGFEVNDAGFQMNADQRFIYSWFNFNQYQPGRWFRSWNIGLNPNAGWDFDGMRLWSQINHWGNAQLNNFWSINYFVNNRWSAHSAGALRGGPAIHVPGSNNFSLNINSDRRKPVLLGFNINGNREQETGALRRQFSTSVSARPSPRVELSLQPSVNLNDQEWQYVAAPLRVDGTGQQYVFAALDQTTVSMTARLSYTFTRDLSFQLYAQPFLSAGDYHDFRRVAEPRAARFDERFHTFSASEISRNDTTGVYTAGVAGAAVRFRDPDFNIRSLRSNAVVRWEYRPGSTLFVVWSQARGDRVASGRFDFRRNVDDLWGLAGTNVLLIKLNYWLNM